MDESTPDAADIRKNAIWISMSSNHKWNKSYAQRNQPKEQHSNISRTEVEKNKKRKKKARTRTHTHAHKHTMKSY